MAASFPTSVKSFTTRADGAGNYIYASIVNDLQDEVAAVETWAMQAKRGIFNVLAYGADPTGVSDSAAAFNNAIAAVQAAGGLGVVYAPAGAYLASTTINLGAAVACTLLGAGKFHTKITATFTGAPLIRLGSTSLATFNQRVIDICLIGTAPSSTGSAVSGSYGIQFLNTDPYATAATEITNCWVTNFMDDAINIAGSTGPVAVRDCTIASSRGWGIHVGDRSASTQAPQDVTVYGGSIQDIWGGIKLDNAYGFSCYETDIELINAGQYPAIWIKQSGGGSYGCLFSGLSVSMNTVPSPAALIYVEDSGGHTFIGCQTLATGGVMDNFYFTGTAAQGNTIVGGFHAACGGGSTGYFATLTQGTDLTVITPLLASNYESGKNRVRETSYPYNRAITLGMPNSEAGANVNTLGTIAIANPVTATSDVPAGHLVTVNISGTNYTLLAQ